MRHFDLLISLAQGITAFFPNSGGADEFAECSFLFHPNDEEKSPGIPDWKKPLQSNRSL
jgi:hypothetical protein